MIFSIKVIQETMGITDPSDTMIPLDIIKVSSEIDCDQLVDLEDIINVTEVQVDSEKIHAIILTAHAHQVVYTLDLDVYVGIMNILGLIHPYAGRLVSDIAAHNIHLQIANVLHRWIRSRRT